MTYAPQSSHKGEHLVSFSFSGRIPTGATGTFLLNLLGSYDVSSIPYPLYMSVRPSVGRLVGRTETLSLFSLLGAASGRPYGLIFFVIVTSIYHRKYQFHVRSVNPFSFKTIMVHTQSSPKFFRRWSRNNHDLNQIGYVVLVKGDSVARVIV